MKKLIIASLGIGLFCLLINSCRKNNIAGDSKDLVLGSYIILDSSINQNLDFSNNAATVSIKVGSKGSPVASVNIYVATGSSSLDTSKWVLIKNVPYSDGVVLSVSTAELAAALAPNVIQPGNQYVLQNQVVTKDGRRFSVSNTPSTYNSFPAYKMALSWKATAVCAFNQAASAGSYKVVTDTWVDYKPGDPITVLAGPAANEINLLMYPSVILGGGTGQVNVIIDVDPATGTATIKKQFTGYYGSASPGNLVTLSGSGFVFSCTGVINMNMTINVGGTDYAGYTFAIQHQ